MFSNNIKLLYTLEPVQSDGKDDKKSKHTAETSLLRFPQ